MIKPSARAWIDDAACANADPQLFFPEEAPRSQQEEMRQQAAQICNTCPVQQMCRREANAHGEKFGIWAGQDRSIKKVRRTQMKLDGGASASVSLSLTAKGKRQQRNNNTAAANRAARIERDARIVELREQGHSPASIANTVGVTERTVFRAVAAAARKRATPSPCTDEGAPTNNQALIALTR